MVRFWLSFLGTLAVYFYFSMSSFYGQYIDNPVSTFYARISAGVLNLFGYGITVTNVTMTSTSFSMSVANGCEAVAPMVMLTSAILFYPYGTFNKKLKGLSIGLCIIFLLNLLRLTSLFIMGVHARDWFDLFHVEFWQAAFIIISMVYFVLWLKKSNS
jgi:exosortase/archaeosortase family protein